MNFCVRGALRAPLTQKFIPLLSNARFFVKVCGAMQSQQLVWITSILSMVMASPVWAGELKPQNPQDDRQTNANQVIPSSEILSLNQMEQPATTISEWVEQIAQAAVRVTGIRVNNTETGVAVILDAEGQLAEPVTSVVGDALILEIPSAVLALPAGDEFQQADPAAGIALISVTNLANNRVRVAITGTDAPPVAEARTEAQGLFLSIAPDTSAVGAAEDDAIQIVVTGEEAGYRVPSASVGTRTDTPLENIPQSIQVVPQQVITEQRATNVGEALRNVAGVSADGSTLTIFSDFVRIRGFTIGRDYFTNGVRNQFGGYNLGLDTANIEQLEVLRGPGSVLYGQGEPGGVINIVTKQPLADPFYAADLTVGSYEFYRPEIDLAGPLNEDRTILYRFNAAYQNSAAFIDEISIERYLLAPVISFQLGDNTNLTVEGSYQNFAGPYYAGLPARGTVLDNPLGDVPRSRYLGDATAENVHRTVGTIGYRLEHDFNEDWSIRNALRYEFLYTDEIQSYTTALQDDNRTVERSAFSADGWDESYVFQTDMIGNFATGSITHDLVAGVELRRVTGNGRLAFADLPTIDLFDPEYGGIGALDFAASSESTVFQNILGIYVQDLLSIGDDWHVLLGGRFDLVDQTFYEGLTDDKLEQQDTAFTPRVGVVYRPVDPLSLYASYSRSFAPSDVSARNADGSTFEPTRGEQFEIGARAEFLDGRAAANLALYQLTRQNITTADPDRPGFSIQTGEERSRGIELDVAGELLPGLNLIATYAYTDTEITEDNNGNQGNRPYDVPFHSGSLWMTYELPSGDLEGLGFGAGIFAASSRQGDNGNTFEVPGYIRTDAALFYRRRNWEVGINVKNLFDVEYVESAFSQEAVFFGSPFTILGTVSVEF
jgi:iron complex outermembrane recepter protein